MSNSKFTDRCGVQVLAGFSSISQALKELAEREVRIVEINLNNPSYLNQLNDSKVRGVIARITKDEGIRWTAHLPENLGFFEIDEEVFMSYLERQLDIQKKAQEAGCSALTVHMGAAPHFAWSGQRRQGVTLFDEYYRKVLAERLKRAHELLAKGPHFCFENVGGFHLEFVREILDNVGWDAYNMDIGHLKVAHRRIADAEFEFYTRHVEDIRVVHVHDNDGEWDQHLSATDPEALEPYWGLALSSDAYLIVEVRPLEAALTSLKALTGIQRHL
ncbi:sugar phosphate isomerase/epimerase [candidate division WOR-3 bacterium]|nr:sugar phosphate isomerase/epimerase [candidate division WOR-3 bacterium]